MGLTNTLIVIGCAIAIFIIGKIFLFPIKKILKLVLNTIIGGAIIYIINLVGANFRISYRIKYNNITCSWNFRYTRSYTFNNFEICNRMKFL